MLRARFSLIPTAALLSVSGLVVNAGAVSGPALAVGQPARVQGWQSVSVAQQDFGTTSHTCALRTDSTLWCWGGNADGQLGLGDVRVRYSPVRVGKAADWSDVATGWNRTCGISSGSLYCWGAGYQRVPTRIGSSSTWAAVSVGDGFQCATQSDASLWCWGSNDHGQLGLGDTDDRSDPTQLSGTWSMVSTAGVDACGLRPDDTLWCWGSGLDGELGLGDGTWEVHVPTQVGSDADWTDVSAGVTLTCGVRSDGDGYCWGRNDRGQLGTGNLLEQTTPAAIVPATSWASIDVGTEHACAQGTNASLWCWGANDEGQLGIGSVNDTDEPAQVGDRLMWSSPQAGAVDTCAAQTDTTLWCWGSPESGELGVGGRTGTPHVPTKVGRPDPPPSSQRLLGVDALSPDSVWAVGDQQVGSVTKTFIEHYDGTTWTTMRSPSPGAHANTLNSVTALSDDDVWAVGTADVDGTPETLVLHWDGTTWHRVASPNRSPYENTLNSVAAIAPDDIWAVGSNRNGYEPLIEHWDGSSWTITSVDYDGYSWFGFASVTALSPTDVWAVGSGFVDEEAGWLTITEHWDGTSWTIQRTEHHNRFADHYFRAATAVSSKNVWAFGDELHGQTLIEHWAGTWTKLKTVPQPGGVTLSAATSTGADDVWAMGIGAGRALTLHWDGTTWSDIHAPGPTGSHIYGASALSPSDAWAVGVRDADRPLIEHWDGTAWSLS